ncbi:MAG: SMC-Scp complex subunit ScpB [Deltaproteobacteria bacterium]|nr:SMC-Scp complex subunit ScpB [Deltaproteobacteria bacterium]
MAEESTIEELNPGDSRPSDVSAEEVPVEEDAALKGDDAGAGDDSQSSQGSWPVDRLKPLVEALVFASGEAINAGRLAKAVRGASRQEVTAALQELQAECEARGVRLVEVAGGWQYRTAAEHAEPVRRLFKERPYRLSRAAVETLTVVAYKQPTTRQGIEGVRGVDSGGVLENLVEKRLIRIAGRLDVPGRPLVYETTKDFLELFGLKDLAAMPRLAELGDEMLMLADKAEFEQGAADEAAVLPLEPDDSMADDSKAEDTIAADAIADEAIADDAPPGGTVSTEQATESDDEIKEAAEKD